MFFNVMGNAWHQGFNKQDISPECNPEELKMFHEITDISLQPLAYVEIPWVGHLEVSQGLAPQHHHDSRERAVLRDQVAVRQKVRQREPHPAWVFMVNVL